MLERLPPEALANIAEHLQALYASAVPLSDLDISPGHRAWSLALDVIVAGADSGNVLDAAALAARAALRDLRIPETQRTTVRSAETSDQRRATRVEAGRRAGHFDLVSNHDLGRSIATHDQLPASVTLTLVESDVLVDATDIEASAASTTITAGVHPNGNLTHLHQSGSGELEWSMLMSSLKVRRGLVAQLMPIDCV